MIITSSEGPIQVPLVDILTFTFDKRTDYDERQPLFVDADDCSRYLDYTSCKTLVRKLIAGFKTYGLEHGDCVLCQITNTYLYPALYMGVIGAGGVWLGSNTANQRHEVDHFVQIAKPKFVITEPDSLATILSVWNERSLSKQNVFVLDVDTFQSFVSTPPMSQELPHAVEDNQATRSCIELLCHGDQDWQSYSSKNKVKYTPAAYYPTSGTTGLPKLAIISHWNLIAHHLTLHQETTYKVRRLMSLPLFHIFATSYTFIQPLRYGYVTYIMKRWNLDKYLQYCEKHKVSEIYMAPPMLIAMLQADLNVKKSLKSIHYAGVGGAPCDAVCINNMRALLTNATVSSVWGMTEIGVATTFRYGDHDKTGSIGKLMRGVEGKLLDTNGNLVRRHGEPGELYIRSQGVMLGYRNVELSEDEREWFRTGDVCSYRDGKLYIVGRLKELIKVRGWQVAPAEIEAVLLQHPDIIDVAVCGAAAMNGIGETPRAYVVRRNRLREAEMITVDEVYQFARSRLASYKAIDGGVYFVEGIPRTASGKIQRSKLARIVLYRHSITADFLANDSLSDKRDKVLEFKDCTMHDIDEARQDTEPLLRRNEHLSERRSGTSSCKSEERPCGILQELPRRKVAVGHGDSKVSDAVSQVSHMKAQRKKSRRSTLNKIGKAIQAAAA